MAQVTTSGYMVLVLLIVTGMTVPAAAVTGGTGVAPPSTNSGSTAAMAAADNATQNNSSVNVTVGQQLSTVIDVSSDEVQTDYENTAFEVSIEGADDEQQAEAIAERTEELRERAEEIREDYEEATAAYEAGEISKSEYAQRLATLNARATNLLESYEQLQQRADNVSALELRAAGVNESALDAAVENLSSVNGTGPAALLEQFTGQSEGQIEIETADGLQIEIESEDGEQSRELERPRDDNDTITVSQSAALETARAALSTTENGSWTLTEATVKQDDGAYEFAFVLREAPNQTGEAEVSVDGSSGEIFKLEEEIEARDDEAEDEEDEADDEHEEEEEDDDEDEEGELALLVAEGTPAPNATVTLQVLADGAPAANVTVFLNDQMVGTTNADGTITVTLPASGEAELDARKGEAEGELEFEFEEDEEDDEAIQKLNVDSTLDDDTVTVVVTYDGAGVANATVYANDQIVGTTGSDGTVTFTVDANATDELELEIVKGVFEAELAYDLHDGSLVLTEEEHEGDGDKTEADEDEADEEEDEDDEEEDDDDEDDDEEEDDEEEDDDEEDDD